MPFRSLREAPAAELSALLPRLHQAVYDASAPFADWYFGDPALAREIIGEWMQRESSELYLGRAVLMSDDAGAPEGCVLWASAEELAACRAADFATFVAELGSGPEADAIVQEVVAGARALFPPVDPGAAYISRVGLVPAVRGRGLGRPLIEGCLAHLRQQGFARVRLDVSADNTVAIRVYEGCGFATIAETAYAPAGLAYRAMGRGL